MIVSEALLAPVSSCTIKALETSQTSFLWNDSTPDIKHKTIFKNLRGGRLKMLIYKIN